jgi:nucleoside 2-deoxyribosyltransferase
MPAKLRCFVAMAFGQKDTDAIFRALRKTLGPLGVNAQRVDRIEHNDNIDTRIISEIEAADLVIADLTYARPSVYFEAGYAQRAIRSSSRPEVVTSGNATTTRTATAMSISTSRCATSSRGHRRTTAHSWDD